MFWNWFLSPWATTSRMRLCPESDHLYPNHLFFFAIESLLMEPLVNIISSPITTTFGGNYWSLFLTSCKRPLDAAWSAIICSLHVQSYFDRTDKERLLVIAWNYTCRKQWIYSPTPKSRKRKNGLWLFADMVVCRLCKKLPLGVKVLDVVLQGHSTRI